LRLGSLDRFILRIVKKESPISSDNSNNSNSSSPIPRGNWIIIALGIAITAIGFAGAIYILDHNL
jgi:hypothetical protein